MSNKGFPVMMSTCFWCGEAKNEILLGRRMVADVDKYPHKVVRGYDPCDNCRVGMESGIALIEASDRPFHNKQEPIQKDSQGAVYPSGNYLVVRPEAIDGLVSDPDTAALIKEKGKAFLEPAMFELISPEKEPDAEEKTTVHEED